MDFLLLSDLHVTAHNSKPPRGTPSEEDMSYLVTGKNIWNCKKSWKSFKCVYYFTSSLKIDGMLPSILTSLFLAIFNVTNLEHAIL